MKTLTILMLLFAGVSFAQVGEIKEIDKPVTVGIANNTGLPKLQVHLQDNIYVLLYINEKYSILNDIETLSFIANEDDIDRLYSLFKEQANKTTKTEIELGDDFVYLSFENGRLVVHVLHNEGSSSYFYLQPNELENLFGKV